MVGLLSCTARRRCVLRTLALACPRRQADRLDFVIADQRLAGIAVVPLFEVGASGRSEKAVRKQILRS